MQIKDMDPILGAHLASNLSVSLSPEHYCMPWVLTLCSQSLSWNQVSVCTLYWRNRRIYLSDYSVTSRIPFRYQQIGMLWDSFFTATQSPARGESPADFLCAGGGLDLEVLLCTCAAVVLQWRELLVSCSTFSSAILIAQVRHVRLFHAAYCLQAQRCFCHRVIFQSYKSGFHI